MENKLVIIKFKNYFKYLIIKGKAVLIKDKSASFKPYVVLNCCSIETNFGKDLETKPFIYDFSKHLAPKFY